MAIASLSALMNLLFQCDLRTFIFGFGGPGSPEAPFFGFGLRALASVKVWRLLGAESLHLSQVGECPMRHCSQCLSLFSVAVGCGFFDSTPIPLYYAAWFGVFGIIPPEQGFAAPQEYISNYLGRQSLK